MKYNTFNGLDVHKNFILVGVAQATGGEAEFCGTILNTKHLGWVLDGHFHISRIVYRY